MFDLIDEIFRSYFRSLNRLINTFYILKLNLIVKSVHIQTTNAHHIQRKNYYLSALRIWNYFLSSRISGFVPNFSLFSTVISYKFSLRRPNSSLISLPPPPPSPFRTSKRKFIIIFHSSTRFLLLNLRLHLRSRNFFLEFCITSEVRHKAPPQILCESQNFN